MNNLELSLKQRLSISNKIITSLEIMSLNIMELYSFLEKESEENVFIDYDSFFEDKLFRDYIKNDNNIIKKDYTTDEEEIEIFDRDKYEPTLFEILLEQLGTSDLSEEEYVVGELIIHSLDHDGYMRDDLGYIAELVHTDVATVEKVLSLIKTFEPVGIGAGNLQECLILQVPEDEVLMRRIIQNHINDLYKNNLDKIAKKENISIEEVKEVFEKIKKLNPRPSIGYKSNNYESMYIYPDICVEIVSGELKLSFKDSISNIHANKYYLSLLDGDIDDETRDYLKKKLTRTMLIIESINKRKETIEKIANFIINSQKNHILYDEPLQDLNIKDISTALNLSESTVSRAIKHKHVQTPRHMYKLRNLLSLHCQHTANAVSKNYIMDMIKNMIETEDKKAPLSDERITEMLNDEGISIKRRTVSKYRGKLSIPTAKLRKEY